MKLPLASRRAASIRRRRKRGRRTARIEVLEQRQLMAGDGLEGGFSNWHNESNPLDVNGDGNVTAVDALQVINALSRFDAIGIDEIRSDLQLADAAADELFGGYHPDVDLSGNLTAVDALRVINQLSRIRSLDGVVPVSVIPDDQGSPLSVIYAAADGRSKEVDVSGRELSIQWVEHGIVATDSSDEIIVIAKPGVGVLEVDNSGDDGLAVVTRLGADGSEVVERYVCLPDTVWDRELELIIAPIEANDVRRPIVGFEEVIGAMVEQRTVDSEGAEIVRRYEEAAAPNLLSLSATLASGQSMTVVVEGATLGPETIVLGTDGSGEPITADLDSFESDVLFLLREGFQPFETVTPGEVRVALESVQAS